MVYTYTNEARRASKMENRDLMKVLDENETAVLYKLENDIFDTVALVYNEGTENEETYVLTDMQGMYPKTLDEANDYDWVRAEDVDW